MTDNIVSLDLPASIADALAATITPTATDGAMLDQLIGDLRAVSCPPGTPPQNAPPDAGLQH